MEGLIRTWKESDRPRRTHKLETVDGGICQDMERNRWCEAHSPTGDGRGGNCQDIEKIPQTEAYSLPKDGIERDLSRHGQYPTEQDTLTPWRRHREGLVRAWKKIGREKRAHSLEMAEGGTCQDRKEEFRARGTHALKSAEKARSRHIMNIREQREGNNRSQRMEIWI